MTKRARKRLSTQNIGKAIKTQIVNLERIDEKTRLPHFSFSFHKQTINFPMKRGNVQKCIATITIARLDKEI